MPRMPQAPEPDQARTELAEDDVEVVLGVDTHKDVHVAAVISKLGALLGTRSFPTTALGYRQHWAIDSCWAGRSGSAPCGAPAWSAPAPTGRP